MKTRAGVLLLACACLVGAGRCPAEPLSAPSDKTLDGYLGAGAMAFPKYAGSASRKVWPVPLADFDYRETAYIHIDRAGVRFWGTADKKIALGVALQPRFGFSAKDGARLSGLPTRHDRIEGGPSAEWESPWISLSLGYFTGWSEFAHGAVTQLSLFHQLADDARWDVGLYVDLERLSRKTAQYYFGINAAEASPSRPAFEPGPTVNSTLGISGAYKIGNGYAVLFGTAVEVLGSSAAQSPIVERRAGATTYVGIGVVF